MTYSMGVIEERTRYVKFRSEGVGKMEFMEMEYFCDDFELIVKFSVEWACLKESFVLCVRDGCSLSVDLGDAINSLETGNKYKFDDKSFPMSRIL